MTKEEAASKDSVPDKIGPYRVIRRLGAGGMGVVYLAHDPKLDRQVAIKSIRGDKLDQPRAVARFRREVRALTRLRHPFLVQIYDLVEEDGQQFLVMEYVEGRTLDQVLAETGPLAIEQATSILGEVLEGLVAMHGRGLVHRDLKAENVVLAQDGHMKILDFGLVKPLGSAAEESSETLPEETVSAADAVVGTGYAMAPEQARGLKIDDRADLFAVGVLAYRLLTGEKPFHGTTRSDLLARLCSERQRPVHGVRSEVPAALSHWVDSLLEKSPEDRPISAPAALESLRAGSRPSALGSDTAPGTSDRWENQPADEHAARAPARAELDVPATPAARSRRGLVAASFTAVIILGFWLLWPSSFESPTVVVIEPVNTHGRSELDWWSRAVAEGLYVDLAGSARVQVLTPEWVAETRRLLGDGALDDKLLEALGADYVISGSYVPLDDLNEAVSLRIDLVRVGSRSPVWGQAFNVTTGGLWSDLEAVSGELRRRLKGAAPAGGEAKALGASLPDPASGAARLYAEGVERLRALDPIAALESLEQAKDLDPTSPLVRVAIADALTIQGKVGSAADAVAAALELPGSGLSNQQRLLIRARGHALANEREQAAAIFSQLFAEEPDNLDLGLRYAEALRLDSRANEARSITDSLLRLPLAVDDPRLHLLRARIAFRQEEWARQLEDAVIAQTTAEAWQARPAIAEALLYQVIAHSGLGDRQEANLAMRRALELAATFDGDVLHTRLMERAAKEASDQGELGLALELSAQAEASYRRLGNDSGLARLLLSQGVTQARAGEAEQAAETFSQARAVVERLESRGMAANLMLNIAALQLSFGQLEEAASTNLELIEIFDDLQQESAKTLVIANLAEVRFMEGKLGESESLFERARRRKIAEGQSEHYELHFLGRIALAQGHRQRAGDLFRWASEKADAAGRLQDRTQIQLSQAELAWLSGELGESRDLVLRALETARGGDMAAEIAAGKELLERLDEAEAAGSS